MLESLPDDVFLIVIDNGSEDVLRTAGVVETHGAQLIRNDKNVGFGGAFNHGARLVGTELMPFSQS